MSKTGQAYFEGQEFAEQFYNENRNVFIEKAEVRFGKHTFQYGAAIDAFDIIQDELNGYFSQEPDYEIG